MATLSLVCVPFAGAGAAFFRSWRAPAAPDIDLVPVRLPGRERLIEEEPLRSIPDVVRRVLPEVLESTAGTPVALFGHSSGGALAHALAHAMAARTGTEVVRLFVSGAHGPGSRRARRATGLPDEQFLERVQEFAGARHPALDNPQMRELILPTLRADVEMYEDYHPDPDTVLPVPVTALRGRDDDCVSAAEAQEWSKTTGLGFEYVELPGGHMYLNDAVPDLLRVIRASTADAPVRGSGDGRHRSFDGREDA
ncbi:thioesterase II family protein [Streptomyces sp. NPDC018045]|uniref:thioesterase II family protein n=1 Tax=Streptomyces sp. NPDC018045 TaxID=3365037 RepID=UPI0037A4E544